MKNKGHEKFLEEMRSIFGDTFDFSKFVYINGRTKGIVICPTHGEFLKLPKKLSLGSGCPYCSGYEMDSLKKPNLYMEKNTIMRM